MIFVRDLYDNKIDKYIHDSKVYNRIVVKPCNIVDQVHNVLLNDIVDILLKFDNVYMSSWLSNDQTSEMYEILWEIVTVRTGKIIIVFNGTIIYVKLYNSDVGKHGVIIDEIDLKDYTIDKLEIILVNCLRHIGIVKGLR